MKLLNVVLLILCISFIGVAQEEQPEKKNDEPVEEQDPDYFFQDVTPEPEQEEEVKEEKKKDRREMKTLAGRNSHHGGFGALSFRGTNIDGKTAVFAGFRAGWIINRALAIGFEGHGLIPTAKYDGIDPNYRAVLLGGYGGMFLEPIIFSNEVVHLTFPIAGGAGWFGYHRDWEQYNDWNGSLIADDVFWYVEPGIAAELNISRNFRIGLGVTKRFTQDLNLANTDSKEFENPNYFITLKFGTF